MHHLREKRKQPGWLCGLAPACGPWTGLSAPHAHAHRHLGGMRDQEQSGLEAAEALRAAEEARASSRGERASQKAPRPLPVVTTGREPTGPPMLLPGRGPSGQNQSLPCRERSTAEPRTPQRVCRSLCRLLSPREAEPHCGLPCGEAPGAETGLASRPQGPESCGQSSDRGTGDPGSKPASPS